MTPGRRFAVTTGGALLVALAAALVPGTAQAVTAATPPTLAGTPPTGSVGTAYDVSFDVSGDPAPSCSVTGDLPPGVSLVAQTCALTGTPTAGGAFPVTITASNGSAPDAVLDTTVTIDEAPALTDLTVPHATAGQPYSYRLPVVGYPAPTLTLVGPDDLPDGLTLDPDGLLHGTPTAVDAKFGVGLRLENAAGSISYGLHVFVDGVPAVLTSSAPPDIPYGQPYSFQFTATGMPTPSIRVAAGQLPYGLNLDFQTGLLSGTTTQLGDFPVTIGATNGQGQEDQHTYTLHVVGTAPQINNTPPPAAAVNSTYSFTFDTTGSNPPPLFTLESGTLPAGIALYSNGVLYGYPTQITAGSPVTIVAANGVDPDLHYTFTLAVTGSPLTITGTPPSPATVGSDYYFGYTRTGSPASTTTVTSGALPDGVTLSSNGYLTGHPTIVGSYTFTVTASNGGISPDATITSTIEVTGVPAGISGTPPTGAVGQPYSFAFTRTGTPQPSVTQSGGTLPPGLALLSNGTLSGTPTQGGSFRFTVLADNGVRPASEEVTLTVLDPVTISVSDQSVTEGNSGTRAITFTVALNHASAVPVTVYWGTSAGTATPGSDYVCASGRLTFAPGATVATVTVNVKGDRKREPTEVFHLRLTRPAGATLADGDALGRIVNDD